MTWLAISKPPRIQRRTEAQRSSVPDHTWIKCKGCHAPVYAPEFAQNLDVCPACGHHAGMAARRRVATLFDAGSAEEIGGELRPTDPLQFRDSATYRERVQGAQRVSGESDALLVQAGTLEARPLVVACFEYSFMGGSMGSVVGERFVRGVDAACVRGLPFVCITASGGARMQEGLFSLMQMSKTTAALAQLRRLRLPFVSILTNPTMGGVSASFAFLADVVIAEPGALIGFAGPRVIEQTVREKLPEGFQRAEFLQRKGAVDLIVDRRAQRDMLHRLLGIIGDATGRN